MNVATIAGGSGLQYSELTAVVCRKGLPDQHLVLARFESDEHKATREAMGLELPAPTFNGPQPLAQPSWLRKLLALVGLGAIALAVHAHPDMVGPAIAATVITNAGQAINTNRMIGSGTEAKYVAWGTGAGTAAVTDTTLFTESTEETRTTGTSSRATTTVTNDTYQVVGTITVATSNKTITNVGLFDASTGGNMFLKSDFTGLALTVTDSITFTLKTKYA